MMRAFGPAVLFLFLILFTVPAFSGQTGCPLYTDDTPPRAVAGVAVPEGFSCLSEESVAGETPEYYLVPTEAESNVRFLYYTTGRGDPQTLAKAALSSYGMLYDEFSAGEIRQEAFAERDCLYFDYTCAYPTRTGDAMVYEQTAVAYIPVDGDAFIACIASLAFDDPEDYFSGEEMHAFLMFAMQAIELCE